jgi:hypothetical protein
MSLTSKEKNETQKLDLIELGRQEQLKTAVSKIDYLSFGPCLIMPETWKWLKLAVQAYGKNPMPKEISVALIGHLETNRFIIESFVQLSGESGREYSLFTAEDLKKIEAEASKKGFGLIGILHTHPETITPSIQDRLAWLTLMFEFDRPLLYFILQLEPLRLAAYSVPSETLLLLKESIKFIECKSDDL